ncbi:MAG TPA: DinB family protein [Anaerolineae bacterium]|nr:DinB family protein [Anaerolineae bacterium]
MMPMLQDYFDRLLFLHVDLRRAIEGLPPDALDWSPGPQINSIAVLAVHTAGAERYWIGDVIGQDPSGRVREAEFQARGLAAAELIARLDAALSHSQSVIDRLTLADLDMKRTSPRDRREVSVAWALTHTLEHTAIHLGHMQLMRQLWEQR